MKHVVRVLAAPKHLVVASLATALLFRRHRAVAIQFATSVPLAVGITNVLKRCIDEDRPNVRDRHPHDSFPSGHSAAAAAFLTSAILAGRLTVAAPLVAAAIAAVNVVRVRHLHHWKRDVVAGDAIGIASALGGHLIARIAVGA